MSKSTYNVTVTETNTSIIKTYDHLPTIPKILTMAGILFQPITLFFLIISDDLFEAGNGWLAIFDCGIFVWNIVSLFGIHKVRRWGFIALFSLQCACAIVAAIRFSVIEMTAGQLVFHFMIVLLYLCSFFFEEYGHRAFEIIWHNGVIEEKKE